MSLLTRLVAPLDGEEKIPIHQFMAAITEFDRGAPGVTPNSIQIAFNLSTSERSQLTTWYTNHWQAGAVFRELVHDVLLLGEGGQYTLSQVGSRLGL